MNTKEQVCVAILLLSIFLFHYIKLSLRVRRLERGVIYAVSLDRGLMSAIAFAERNLDGSLDYEMDFFSSGHVYSLYDAREVAKMCEGVVVNKHTKEIIEDYRDYE